MNFASASTVYSLYPYETFILHQNIPVREAKGGAASALKKYEERGFVRADAYARKIEGWRYIGDCKCWIIGEEDREDHRWLVELDENDEVELSHPFLIP